PETLQVLREGAEHHRAGQLQLAEEKYRLLLAQLPSQPDALHLLRVLCHQTQRHPESPAPVEKTISVAPSCVDFHVNLGEAKRAMDRNSEAEACYRRALELEPEHAGALNNIGLVLCALNRVDEAIEFLNRAVAIAPQLAEAHDNLGIA